MGGCRIFEALCRLPSPGHRRSRSGRHQSDRSFRSKTAGLPDVRSPGKLPEKIMVVWDNGCFGRDPNRNILDKC